MKANVTFFLKFESHGQTSTARFDNEHERWEWATYQTMTDPTFKWIGTWEWRNNI